MLPISALVAGSLVVLILMPRPKNALGYFAFACGIMTILFGLVGFVLSL